MATAATDKVAAPAGTASAVPASGAAAPWRAREAARLASGEYIPPPATWKSRWWYELASRKFYPHVSKAEPGLIAYTQSDEKGARDVQGKCKPGRFFTHVREWFDTPEALEFATWIAPLAKDTPSSPRHMLETAHTQVGADRVPGWVQEWEAHATPAPPLKLATTPLEIAGVYTCGPHSCMQAQGETRAYGAGDLAVAYLTDPADEAHILARCIAWPAKKIHIERMYGDSVKLTRAFQEAGYRPAGGAEFVGARLLRIPYKDNAGNFIAPALDCFQGVVDDGEFLRVVDAGGFQREVPARRKCSLCAEWASGLTTVGRQHVCAACVKARVRQCAHCSAQSILAKDEPDKWAGFAQWEGLTHSCVGPCCHGLPNMPRFAMPTKKARVYCPGCTILLTRNGGRDYPKCRGCGEYASRNAFQNWEMLCPGCVWKRYAEAVCTGFGIVAAPPVAEPLIRVAAA